MALALIRQAFADLNPWRNMTDRWEAVIRGPGSRLRRSSDGTTLVLHRVSVERHMATTLKLPPELKERVASVARGKGKSPHAFMLEAIEQQTAREEKRQQFLQAALAAQAETLSTGKGFAADEVHAYVKARIRGKKAARPQARQWRR